MASLTTLKNLSVSEIERILDDAERLYEVRHVGSRNGHIIANLFFESSTRTKCSFEMAQKQLGIDTLHFDVATSSVTKGESLYDTAKTLESIGCDAFIIRHGETRYYEQLEGITVPIINAGDGSGDHPTQSLLDLLTIRQEFGLFRGIKVVIAGDILHSRVAHSNIDVLERLGADVYVSGPREWIDDTIPEEKILTMDEAVNKADVIMLLRIQLERHEKKSLSDPESFLKNYGLTVEREQRMKSNAIIMHPAPVNRGVEIDTRLVECERSRIFKQMNNGVAIRKAVLVRALHKKEAPVHVV